MNAQCSVEEYQRFLAALYKTLEQQLSDAKSEKPCIRFVKQAKETYRASRGSRESFQSTLAYHTKGCGRYLSYCVSTIR